MGEERAGLDRGIFYVLTALVYIAIAIILLNRTDWNPHTPYYEQYLVGVPGEYTSGTVFGDGYALLSADGNAAYLVLTDRHGEIRSAYALSPVPAAVLHVKGRILIIFAEGNALQVVGFDGTHFGTLSTVSTSWQLHPISPPRILEGTRAVLFATRDRFRAALLVSLDRNVQDPFLRAFFCRDCDLTPLYNGPHGHYVFSMRRQPLLITPASSEGISVRNVRSTPAIFVTDVCKDIFTGIDANHRSVWGRIGADRFYEANVQMNSFPVCHGDRVFLNTGGYLTVLDVSELNAPRAYRVPSSFSPSAAFDDVPYLLLAGGDGGNPSFLRNPPAGLKCPDLPDEVNVSVSVYPLSFERYDGLHFTTLSKYPAKPFAEIRTVNFDEDFRCYKT